MLRIRGVRARLLPLTLVALFATSMLVPSSALAKKTLALSSGTFAFEVAPGKTGQGEVVVIDDGDEPINVLVYAADVQIDDKGAQTYPLPQRQGASLITSPASWFRVYMPADSKSVGNTPYLQLKPGQRVPVKFDFSPPPNASPGDHNVVLFFEMFDFGGQGEGSVAQITGRIGARVAVRVSGDVVEKLEIRPFDVPAIKVGTKVPYAFTIRNGGNLNKTVTVDVTLLDRSEREVVASQVASETTVYASSNLEFTGQLDTVAGRLGPHKVEVRVRYLPDGSNVPREIVEQRDVWLVPLWLTVTVAVAIFVLAVWSVYRMGRRSAERRTSRGEPRSSRSGRRARDTDAEERRRRREERAAQYRDEQPFDTGD